MKAIGIITNVLNKIRKKQGWIRDNYNNWYTPKFEKAITGSKTYPAITSIRQYSYFPFCINSAENTLLFGEINSAKKFEVCKLDIDSMETELIHVSTVNINAIANMYIHDNAYYDTYGKDITKYDLEHGGIVGTVPNGTNKIMSVNDKYIAVPNSESKRGYIYIYDTQNLELLYKIEIPRYQDFYSFYKVDVKGDHLYVAYNEVMNQTFTNSLTKIDLLTREIVFTMRLANVGIQDLYIYPDGSVVVHTVLYVSESKYYHHWLYAINPSGDMDKIRTRTHSTSIAYEYIYPPSGYASGGFAYVYDLPRRQIMTMDKDLRLKDVEITDTSVYINMTKVPAIFTINDDVVLLDTNEYLKADIDYIINGYELIQK